MFAKISGILPSNSRITSVDVKSERPMRPGGPDLGLPISKSRNLTGSMPGFDATELTQQAPIEQMDRVTLGNRPVGPDPKIQKEVSFFEARRTERPQDMANEIVEPFTPESLNVYA